MGLFGALNQTVLLISYIVYLLLGLSLLVVGLVYVGSVGAVGQTGVYMLTLGLFFLIVGVLALIGLKYTNWIILCVIELVNIVLYFVLFIVIIVAIMIGSGAKDPVQKLFDENWASFKMELFAGNGGTYEQSCTSGTIGNNPKCLDFFGQFKSRTNCNTLAERGSANVPGDFGLNCTKFDDTLSSGSADCVALKSKCVDCAAQCKQMYVKESKDKNIPACIITILVCLYCVGVLVMHTLNRMLTDGGEGACCKDIPIIGWVTILVDVGFSCFGLTVCLLATLIVNTDKNGSVGSLWAIMLIVGGALLFIPVAQIVFVSMHGNPNYILDIVVAFLFFVLSLVAVFLGFLSGALVEDMNSLYDSNYAKYRGELELAEPTYCQLNQAECKAVITTGANILPLPAEDRASAPATMAFIDQDELWLNMHTSMQKVPYKNLPPNHIMQPCDSSELCIRCMPAITALNAGSDVLSKATLTSDGSGTYNDTRDAAKGVVNVWTGNLHKKVMDNGGYQGGLAKKLARCENALLMMSGASMESLWDDFPNPALPCNIMGSVVATNGLGRGFMLRLPTDAGYQVQSALQGMANSTGTGAYEPTISADQYNRTFLCAKYLLAMTEKSSTFAARGQCKSDGACRTTVESNFDAVYSYMNHSGGTFCQYPDLACKSKVSYYIEKEFVTISIIGIFIMVFQLSVIFVTYFGMMEWLPDFLKFGGGDDDDDDDDDGDDDDGDDDGDDDDDE